MEDSQAIDVPIGKLRPRRERKVAKRDYDRIVATIKAVGLIEPLIVFPEGENYEILDGTICYRALLELGVQVVPCILGKKREALTGNRMVNRVPHERISGALRWSWSHLTPAPDWSIICHQLRRLQL